MRLGQQRSRQVTVGAVQGRRMTWLRGVDNSRHWEAKEMAGEGCIRSVGSVATIVTLIGGIGLEIKGPDLLDGLSRELHA